MRVIVPVLIVLVGVGIVLYPVIATTVNNAYQQKIAREYDEQFRDSDSVESQAKIEEAREYNARVAGQPILDPWLARISLIMRIIRSI